MHCVRMRFAPTAYFSVDRYTYLCRLLRDVYNRIKYGSRLTNKQDGAGRVGGPSRAVRPRVAGRRGYGSRRCSRTERAALETDEAGKSTRL